MLEYRAVGKARGELFGIRFEAEAVRAAVPEYFGDDDPVGIGGLDRRRYRLIVGAFDEGQLRLRGAAEQRDQNNSS